MKNKIKTSKLIINEKIEQELEKIVSRIVNQLIRLVKIDKVEVLGSIHRDGSDVPYTLIIDSTEYGYFAIWNMNEDSSVAFDDGIGAGRYLSYIPEKLRAKFRKVLRVGYEAAKINLPYDEYLQKMEDEKTKKEIGKAKEIVEAKRVLEKYNITN